MFICVLPLHLCWTLLALGRNVSNYVNAKESPTFVFFFVRNNNYEGKFPLLQHNSEVALHYFFLNTYTQGKAGTANQMYPYYVWQILILAFILTLPRCPERLLTNPSTGFAPRPFSNRGRSPEILLNARPNPLSFSHSLLSPPSSDDHTRNGESPRSYPCENTCTPAPRSARRPPRKTT